MTQGTPFTGVSTPRFRLQIEHEHEAGDGDGADGGQRDAQGRRAQALRAPPARC